MSAESSPTARALLVLELLQNRPGSTAGELASAAAKELREVDAVMVVDDGKPVGVLTRHDLLGFLTQGGSRK